MGNPFGNLNDDPRVRFYTSGPPDDPIAESARTGRQRRNAATGYTLFHQSHMPFGEHAGKIMERVPADYLLWLAGQPWAASGKWKPVLDYIQRHHAEIVERASKGKND